MSIWTLSRRLRPARTDAALASAALATAKKTFALGALAGQLARAAHGLGLFAGALLGGLFVVAAQLHLAENAFALHLLLQDAQRLVDIVVTDKYLQFDPVPSVFETGLAGFSRLQGRRNMERKKRFAEPPARRLVAAYQL
jgi:uncharacterized membrane protein (UPF0136 family)